MANSIDTRLTALEANFLALDVVLSELDEADHEGRIAAAETTIKKQHGTIVALQVALKDKGK